MAAAICLEYLYQQKNIYNMPIMCQALLNDNKI